MGRGLLVFKGEDGGKAKKKNKKKTKHASASTPTATSCEREQRLVVDATAAAAAAAAAATDTTAAPQPKIQEGTGLITTSGTVVTGHETRFQRELRVGDAIVIQQQQQQDGNSSNPEMRVVTMCLSDTSLNLSSAFSHNLSRPTSFQFIQKSRTITRTIQQQSAEPSSSSLYDGSSTTTTREVVYREKTEHDSYRIKRIQVDADVSRTDMLHLRSKKTSDKYC
jgi:hypothetical protein